MYDTFLGHSHDILSHMLGESLSFKLLPNFSQKKNESREETFSFYFSSLLKVINYNSQEKLCMLNCYNMK